MYQSCCRKITLVRNPLSLAIYKSPGAISALAGRRSGVSSHIMKRPLTCQLLDGQVRAETNVRSIGWLISFTHIYDTNRRGNILRGLLASLRIGAMLQARHRQESNEYELYPKGEIGAYGEI